MRTPTSIIPALAAAVLISLACPAPGSATHVAASAAYPYPALPHPEWTPPKTRNTTRPRGVVITIHGGAWLAVGAGPMTSMRPDVDRYSSQGFQVVNATYRRGQPAVTDVIRAYDRTRKRVGPRTPICAIGNSAGGHLALMLAARRPSLACAVARAAPTDLPALGDNAGADHARADHARAYAELAFGAQQLARYSPARLASRVPALLANAREDSTIPLAQARRYQARHPSGESVVLGAGGEPFVHGAVSRRDLRRYQARELTFITRASRQWATSRAASPRQSRRARP